MGERTPGVRLLCVFTLSVLVLGCAPSPEYSMPSSKYAALLRPDSQFQNGVTAFKHAFPNFDEESHALPMCDNEQKTSAWTNCFGTLIYPSRNKYVGQFLNGEKHGYGTSIRFDGSDYFVYYIGHWRNGTWHGAGANWYQSGETYIGEWHIGRKHGYGTAIYSDGDKYVGGWYEGSYQGQGVFIHTDGQIRAGVWEKSQFITAQKVKFP